jgi:hypothetical protein
VELDNDDGSPKAAARSDQAALPTYGSGGVATQVAQFEVRQGGSRVFLSKRNCSDLAPQLAVIGATWSSRPPAPWCSPPLSYQAQSWSKPRRVVAKVEWHSGELPARRLYRD